MSAPLRIWTRRGQIHAASGPWYWRCRYCGWLGEGLYSHAAALREALAHLATHHHRRSRPMATSVKMIREHLCTAQRFDGGAALSAVHQALIDLCDVLRPLGPDGKHGDRHTALCGCDGIEPNPPALVAVASGDQPAKPACGFGGCARPIDHPGEHATSTTLEDWARNRPAATAFASGGVITADHVRRMAAPVLDAINRSAATSGLGDALRALMDDADPFWVAEKLADLAALADALRAERDRLADERDTLRAALDQERRSMADRLAVLERIKGERDEARAAVGRVRALLDRWTGTPGAYTDHGSALARAWKSAAIDIEAALDGDESHPCDSGAGAEGSRTRETGATSVFGGVPAPWHGSGLLGRSEGENDEDNRRAATWSDGYRTAAREQLGQDGGRR